MNWDFKELRQRWIKDYNLPSNVECGITSSHNPRPVVNVAHQNRDITSLFNTDDVDLDDEIVSPLGGDMDYMLRNRKVFADHQYTLGSTIGTIRWAKVFPNHGAQVGWQACTRMAFAELVRPYGDLVLELAREHSIGTSVGFVADEVTSPTQDEIKAFDKRGKKPPRSIVRRWRALEFSYTAMPCNVHCQSLEVHDVYDAAKVARIERLMERGVVDRRIITRLGYRDRKTTRQVKTYDDGMVVTMTR